MRARSLSFRLTALTTGVAVLAALVTALVAVRQVHLEAERQVRDELSSQAEVLAATPAVITFAQRGSRFLGIQGLQLGSVDASGATSGAADVLPDSAVRQLLSGESYSGTVSDRLVEARAARGGGAVVVSRPTGDVDTAQRRLAGRLLLPILAGLVLAALAGWALARVLSRPLVTAAAAARRMATGERGLALPTDGPREVQDLTRALSALDSELSAAEGQRKDFLLSVSHEMRTPLTTVRGYAEALADGVVAPAEVARTGAVLLGEAERLEGFVRDLLDLARLDAGEVQLQRVPVDLGAVVEQAAVVWRDRCERQGVELRVELADAAVTVLADPARVRQVLDGLADNALRVTPAGAPLVLSVSHPGRLQVRDGGPGLTDDDLRVAFDRGALRDRYRGVRPTGSGLGLAIVHRLVERQGGSITAGRAPEGGACFTVDLPPESMLAG